MEKIDCLVIGAGIVGLAIARCLANSGREVVVAEQNTQAGQGISSRNSGVIHAGIYYPPNSLKAKLCVAGNRLLYRYCKERSVACEKTGKLIVATSSEEVTALAQYQASAKANGAKDISLLDQKATLSLEPKLRAEAALYSGTTGIIDVQDLLYHFIADIETKKGHLVVNSPVIGGKTTVDKPPEVELGGSSNTTVRCNTVINTAGLDAAKVARSLGQDSVPQLFFSKGHYYQYRGDYPFNHLIYPVASSTGLGIHATLTTNGECLFGPDAQWVESIDYSFDESLKPAFLSAISRYYPAINANDLSPAYTGIRPRLHRTKPSDFYLQTNQQHGIKGLFNLFAIESPGLTASMAIAKYLIQQA